MNVYVCVVLNNASRVVSAYALRCKGEKERENNKYTFKCCAET